MKIFATLAATFIVGLLALGLVTTSGIYNVAATRPHWTPVRLWLQLGMQRSVQFHAQRIEPPQLDDPAMLARGMRHFQTACAICHGAPGVSSWLGNQLRPAAPELSEHAPAWSPAELFWIVKHGLKMTGMPAWETQARDDEVWSVVAFLRQLPAINPEAYRNLIAVPIDDAANGSTPGRLIAMAGPAGKSEAACIRCHGLDGAGPANGAFPRLSGQDPTYLYESLKEYADGSRPSGLMGPVARVLSERDMREVAAYYASLEAAPASPRPRPEDLSLLQSGGALVAIGAADQGIDACASCHGSRGMGGVSGTPVLAGQYRGYLEQQLLLWKAGVRGGDPTGAMARIARRMSPQHIRAAAAYLASLPPASAKDMPDAQMSEKE